MSGKLGNFFPEPSCVENGTWTFEKIELSLGSDGVITLYFFGITVFLFNLFLFVTLLYKFFKCNELSKQQVRGKELSRGETNQ